MIVEDFEPFRAFVTSTLEQHSDLQIVGESSDGLEAVSKAAELQPDLIVLDIGLPSLNGLVAARRILEHSSQSKVLFVSGDQAPEIVEQAFSTGASGYLVKSDAGRQLLTAVRTVLAGENYLSSSLAGLQVNHNARHLSAPGELSKPKQAKAPPQEEFAGRHEAVFYSEDQQLLDHGSRFIASALTAGHGAVVALTRVHREGLDRNLEAAGVNVAAALKQGRYVAMDAAETLSSCMTNGLFDSTLFLRSFENLILAMSSASQGKHTRVAIFGETADLLWKQGNAEAAIQAEKIGNQLSRTHGVDIVCTYSKGVQDTMKEDVLQRICSEHSAVFYK